MNLSLTYVDSQQLYHQQIQLALQNLVLTHAVHHFPGKLEVQHALPLPTIYIMIQKRPCKTTTGNQHNQFQDIIQHIANIRQEFLTINVVQYKMFQPESKLTLAFFLGHDKIYQHCTTTAWQKKYIARRLDTQKQIKREREQDI